MASVGGVMSYVIGLSKICTAAPLQSEGLQYTPASPSRVSCNRTSCRESECASACGVSANVERECEGACQCKFDMCVRVNVHVSMSLL